MKPKMYLYYITIKYIHKKYCEGILQQLKASVWFVQLRLFVIFYRRQSQQKTVTAEIRNQFSNKQKSFEYIK